jgi:hypothetical protein
MIYKEYSNSRVCAVDFYPLFQDGYKEALIFIKKYNLPLLGSNKKSKDTIRFFYHYILDKFCTGFRECSSKYPKVLVVYPLPKSVHFKENELKKILNNLPIPWCTCSSFNSPDVASACLKALQKNTSHKKVHQFADKHSLQLFLQKIKKNKYFSVGTVDLPGDTE